MAQSGNTTQAARTDAGPARMSPSVPWLPVLMYHRVTDAPGGADPYHLNTPPDVFAAQMRSLARGGYRVAPLHEAVRQLSSGVALPGRQAVITFDDGYMDFYANALPVLSRHGYPATVFLVSGLLGKENEWDRGVAPAAPLMGAREVSEARRSGIDFGSHSVTHRRLTGLPPDELRQEIEGSRKALGELLDAPVTQFCYPYGASDAGVRRAAWEAGYSAACGIGQSEHALFNLSRIDAAACGRSSARWWFQLSGWRFRLRRRTAGLRALMRRAR